MSYLHMRFAGPSDAMPVDYLDYPNLEYNLMFTLLES